VASGFPVIVGQKGLRGPKGTKGALHGLKHPKTQTLSRSGEGDSNTQTPKNSNPFPKRRGRLKHSNTQTLKPFPKAARAPLPRAIKQSNNSNNQTIKQCRFPIPKAARAPLPRVRLKHSNTQTLKPFPKAARAPLPRAIKQFKQSNNSNNQTMPIPNPKVQHANANLWYYITYFDARAVSRSIGKSKSEYSKSKRDIA